MSIVSVKTVRRLSYYRRCLQEAQAAGKQHLFSHDIAAATGASPTQVRRDLMEVSGQGNPRQGYPVAGLITALSRFLDPSTPQPVILVGLGNLGRAVFKYFDGRHPKLRIILTFDIDPAKTGRLLSGCPCHRVDEIPERCRAEGIEMAILTVPSAEAQPVADLLVPAGIRGIINFAPVSLRVPTGVFVETMDLTCSLETVAFFSRD